MQTEKFKDWIPAIKQINSLPPFITVYNGKLTRKEICFHEHAEEKMRRRGISKEHALETLENPEEVIEGKYGRKIAHLTKPRRDLQEK